jgi:hypothetical protein
MATVHVMEATSEMAVFDGELPLSERQLERLAEKLAACIEAKKRSEREWRAERSLTSNSVLPGCGCGG